MEYWETFLSEMKSLLSYFMEFSDDESILSKVYPDDYAVERLDQRPIIMITNDESTFSANDGRWKVWTLDGNGILRPKGKRKEIMVSEAFLSWSQLNLFSLPYQQQQELVNSGVPLETAIYFEYGKMEKD